MKEGLAIWLGTLLVIGGIVIYSLFIWEEPSPSPAINTTTVPSQTYPVPNQTYTAPRVSTPSVQTYNGYECTVDCGGHEAGYEWASENDITQSDVDNYDGSSDSFQEGMQSYVDEMCYEDNYYCE